MHNHATTVREAIALLEEWGVGSENDIHKGINDSVILDCYVYDDGHKEFSGSISFRSREIYVEAKKILSEIYEAQRDVRTRILNANA